MRMYKYIEKDETIELSSLLSQCRFIVTDFNEMYEAEDLEITDTFRGKGIKFPDGTYTYEYNIVGGYAEEKKY